MESSLIESETWTNCILTFHTISDILEMAFPSLNTLLKTIHSLNEYIMILFIVLILF